MPFIDITKSSQSIIFTEKENIYTFVKYTKCHEHKLFLYITCRNTYVYQNNENILKSLCSKKL